MEVQYITKLIYKPLIDITQDFNLQESIAKEWSKTSANEYIVRLNEITWHDGSKLTANDIAFTIETIKETESIYNQNVEKIQEVEIIDDRTIKIRLSEETDFFEYMLCFPIVNEKKYNTANIGTGKYKIQEINDKKIILENEERKITFNIYNTVSKLYADFSKEKIDIIMTQNNNYASYIGNIGVSEQLITGREFYYLIFNNKLEKKQKQQIKNLINREQIIYELYNRKYIIADFPLQYGSYLSSTWKMSEQDLDKGQKIKSLNIGISQDEELYKIANLIKMQLEEAKIETNIVNYYNLEEAEKSDYYDLILDKKTVDITPKIDNYFQNEDTKNEIKHIYKIEDKEILKSEYNKIIDAYNQEIPFIGLYFNSYIILHNSEVKGDFTGNWYNLFYNIDTWYKVE